MNIYQTIISETYGYDGIAVIDRNISHSYTGLFRDVDSMITKLAKNGVVRHSRVGILLDDSYEYIVFSLAVLALDAVIIPVSSRAPAVEISDMLEQTACNHLIGEWKFIPENLRENQINLLTEKHCDIHIIERDKEIRPIILEEKRHAAFIRFSSGTTGNSKGVILSHHAVIERTDACVELGVKRGEHVLWVLDMAFHFVVTILLFLRRGATLVISGQPPETQIIKAFKLYPVSMLYATPYHYRMMISSSEFKRDDLKNVRRAFSTAMKLETSDAEAFREKFDIPLTQAYGIIEVGLPCVNISDAPGKMASVGKLQPSYEVMFKDHDASGNASILLRGPGFFDAYLIPFTQKNISCPEGWFDTGDIGYLDSDGFLFITGRAKDIINMGGMKIFPYEVESILMAAPGVKAVRVYAIPMKGLGEVPIAEIVCEDESTLPSDWKNTLRRYAFEHMSAYKVPMDFKLVKSIPRTASGKIKRH